MIITRRGVVSAVALCLVLGLGWLVYAPALGGDFLLDDAANLGGLARIDDLHSALLFIFSGDAGPLGRPIALATFALQADAWGKSAEPFIAVNILIHLLNGGLLAWVLYRLAILCRVPPEGRALVAITTAAVWLFMPLLASASLMVVQRMTTLSATFVLLGLGGYLHTRAGLDVSRGRSLALMSVCLGAGTALATLTKESGALLPLFVLVLEATVLPRPASAGRAWTLWKCIFLVLPAAAIVSYVALRVPYSAAIALGRDFTGWERLITEARVLWQYLFRAFVPQPGAFGPFHDGYPVARTILDPLTFAAVTAWAIVLALAVIWRRRHPLFALSVLWFAAGHTIESTVLPLELYFEHRNYVPIVGPLFGLFAALSRVSPPRRRLVHAGTAAYLLANAAVLFSFTSLWGNPPLASIYWQLHFPDSVRAATTVARHRLKEEGPYGAIDSLHRLVNRDSTVGYLLIPALNLSCTIAPQSDHGREVDQLASLLREANFSYTVSNMLSDLYSTVHRGDCKDVDEDTVLALADDLLQNPRYAGNRGYLRLHHQLVARVLRDKGEFEETLAHLEEAAAYGRDADLNMMIVTTYADAGEYEAAREYISTAHEDAPLHPFRRFVWRRGLDELETYVAELKRARNADAGAGATTP